MPYIQVVTVGLKEIKRTTSAQEAAEIMVAEAKKLADEGAGAYVISMCWIEGYLISNDADVPKALQPDYDIRQHRWVGIDYFPEVINHSHERGWMEKGKWLVKAA